MSCFALHLESRPILVIPSCGPTIDDGQQEQEPRVIGEKLPISEPSCLSCTDVLHERLGKENVEVPDIPEVGQMVVRSYMEELGKRLLQRGSATSARKDNNQPLPSILEDPSFSRKAIKDPATVHYHQMFSKLSLQLNHVDIFVIRTSKTAARRKKKNYGLFKAGSRLWRNPQRSLPLFVTRWRIFIVELTLWKLATDVMPNWKQVFLGKTFMT